jgi:cyclic-di-GMP-binding protein
MASVKQLPMDDIPTTRITAPRAELDRLSFCDTTPAALGEWITGLPMANTADAAAQVRQATWEIARLGIEAEQRMTLLEQIRPILHYLCARLDRNAGVSSSQGDVIARLAQRLQTNLCSGYKSVVIEELNGLRSNDRRANRERLTQAVHRTLSDLSRTLLRTLQFYVEPAERLWFELNQLYLLAERLGVADSRIEDAENHTTPLTTPATAYLRSLLLACSKPNQLRYRQLAEVFNCLEEWSALVTLEPDATSALFAVDLESDQGPVYKKLMRDAVEPRGIRTDVLVYQLESYLRDLPCTIKVPDGTSEVQVSHLAEAWGVMRARSHRRLGASGTIKVCIGLRSAHYFLSGGTEFHETMRDPDAAVGGELNPFLLDPEQRQQHRPTPIKDVWDDAFDLGARIPENPNIEDPERILRQARTVRPAAPDRTVHEIFDTTAIDTSPGGYQIRWNDPLPPHLQTGELLGLREEADSRWCIALIRWIRQNAEGTAMGIELLSPRAIPVAVRAVQKMGGPTSYTRGLLLPELAPIGQPATLITPRMPFQSGQKVHIQKQGIRSTAQLQQCVLRTESVSQFTYRMLSGYLENSHVTLKIGDL